MSLEYKWYAVYTKPRHEKKVAATLTQRGIENYCPLIKTIQQWSDRKKKVEKPLFNSYIFVKVSEREYYDALNITAVVKYVTFNGKAAAIPEKQIEAIKRTIDGNLEFDISTERFKKGDIVTIEYGPMAGVEGEIIDIAGKKQLVIRINSIGYSLAIRINPADIKRN